MGWKEYNENSRDFLKQGTICRTEYGEFIIVGEINTSRGTNDEFIEKITHYTEDFVETVENLIKIAKKDYERKN